MSGIDGVSTVTVSAEFNVRFVLVTVCAPSNLITYAAFCNSVGTLDWPKSNLMVRELVVL